MKNDKSSFSAEVDRVADQFEKEWKPDQPVSYALWLEQVPEQVKSTLLIELLHLDVELRFNNQLAVDPRQYAELGQAAVELVGQLVEATRDLKTRRQDSNRALIGELHGSSSRIGDYQIVSEVARGGMGIVYKARQVKLNRVVALKVIKSGTFASDEEVKRFLIEAEAAARLKHANIVPVFDVGQHESSHFLSMAFIDGSTLQRRIQKEPLSNESATHIIKQVADAVHYAHKQNIVHRDLKPQNILLDRRTTPMVTDFGLAKLMEQDSDLTHTGQILGTPSYMAPEQARGASSHVGIETDVYALGGLLYATLTGRPPFQAASVSETMRQVIEDDPVAPRRLNPAVARDLETICLKCLEKEPQRRYPSAREVANELERFENGIPIQARRASRFLKISRWCGRNPVAAAFAFLTVALLINLAILGPVYYWRYNRLAEKEKFNREAADVALRQADAAKELAEKKTQESERRRREIEQRQSQLTLINDSIQQGNSRIVKMKNYFELLAIEGSFENSEFARMRDYVKQMGRSPVDFREAFDTFLHRYWNRVAHPPMIETNRQPSPSAVAISNEGKLVGVGGFDGTVAVYQNVIGNRSKMWSKKVTDRQIELIFFCDDSPTLIAIDETGKAFVVTPSIHQLVINAPDKNDDLVCASISPDGKLVGVVHASKATRMILWDRESENVKNIDFPAKLQDIQLGGGVPEVLILQKDGNLQLYDYQEKAVKVAYQQPNDEPWTRFTATDSLNLIAASNGRSELYLLESTEPIPQRLEYDKSFLTSLQLLGSSYLAFGYADGKIQVHDLVDNKSVETIAGYGYVSQISISRQGGWISALCSEGTGRRRIVIGTLDRLRCTTQMAVRNPEEIEFRRASTGAKHQDVVIRSGKTWRAVDLANRKTVALAKSTETDHEFDDQVHRRYVVKIQEHAIVVRDIGKQRTLRLDGHSSKPLELAISQATSRLASADAEGSVIVWNLETGKILSERSFATAPIWIRMSPDGQFLGMIANSDSGIALFELSDNGKLSDEPLQTYSRGRFATFSEDSKYLITLDSHRLKFCRIYTAAELTELMENGKSVEPVMGMGPNMDVAWIDRSGLLPTTIATSSDGHLLAIGTRDGKVHLWLIEAGQRVATLNAGDQPIHQIRFSQDNNLLVATSRLGNRVFVWSTYESLAP